MQQTRPSCPMSRPSAERRAVAGGLGLFVHLNRSAEELEPEAMEKAKQEDRKVS